MPTMQARGAQSLSAMSMEGRYCESGISKRQQFGVSPDERHSLCEWKMQARGYQSFVGDVQDVQPSAFYTAR